MKELEQQLREALSIVPTEDLPRVKTELIAAIRRSRFRVVKSPKPDHTFFGSGIRFVDKPAEHCPGESIRSYVDHAGNFVTERQVSRHSKSGRLITRRYPITR